MDWIERIFGISPDGGDGTTELLFVVAAVAIAAILLMRIGQVRDYARRALQRRK
jgi:hypothetical protein